MAICAWHHGCFADRRGLHATLARERCVHLRSRCLCQSTAATRWYRISHLRRHARVGAPLAGGESEPACIASFVKRGDSSDRTCSGGFWCLHPRGLGRWLVGLHLSVDLQAFLTRCPMRFAFDHTCLQMCLCTRRVLAFAPCHACVCGPLHACAQVFESFWPRCNAVCGL